MPKSPAGYLHLAGACCVGQATEILCSWALQGKQLLQAVWSCLYTELPWKSPGPTALHAHISRVYFSRTWFVSPVTWPGFGREFWDEVLGWMWDANWFVSVVKDFLGAVWILSWCKQEQVEQRDTCCESKNIFLGWIWRKVGLSKEFHHKLLQLYGKNTLKFYWVLCLQ